MASSEWSPRSLKGSSRPTGRSQFCDSPLEIGVRRDEGAWFAGLRTFNKRRKIHRTGLGTRQCCNRGQLNRRQQASKCVAESCLELIRRGRGELVEHDPDGNFAVRSIMEHCGLVNARVAFRCTWPDDLKSRR